MRARRVGASAIALLLAATAPAGAATPAADPIVYTSAERSTAAPPARYAAPLPQNFDLRPAAGTWLPRIDPIGPGHPSHLQHRACREGAPERERILAAVREQVADGSFDLLWFGVFAVADCADAPSQASACAWFADVAVSDEPEGVRQAFLERALGCGDFAVALVEHPRVPANRVVGFYRDRLDGGGSPRLAAIVRERARGDDPLVLADAALVFGRRDDPRVARTLLAAHDAATSPRNQRVLALAMERQADDEARARFEGARRESCAELTEARTEDRLRDHWLREPAGRVEALAPCLPSVRWPQYHLPADADHPEEVRRRVAEQTLRARGLAFQYGDNRGPSGDGLLEIAGMVRRLIDLVQPALDPAIVEEVWPALDAIDFERGPVEARVPIPGDALRAFTFQAHLPGEPDRPDPAAMAALGQELRAALDAPRWLDIYLAGERFRFAIEPVARAIPRETVLGVANELLRARGSDVRVAPFDAPELRGIVAGPEWAVRELLRGDLGAIGASATAPR